MNRRQLLTSSAMTMVAAATASPLLAENKSTTRTRSLIDTANDCIVSCEQCLTHCLDELAQGEKAMAECANSVRECIAVCEGLVTLAAMDSSHLKSYVKVCSEVCRACEEICRKHENHHQSCKECAEACRRCIEACEAI